MVPLSEREQKILAEIEKGLYSEEPGDGPGEAADDRRADVRGARIGAVVLVLGFVLLFGFFYLSHVLVGVIAFATMVGGATLLASSVWHLLVDHRRTRPRTRERLARLLLRLEDRLRQRYNSRH